MSSGTGFDLRWATQEDDADIRALVASVAMPGAIAVRFVREPDYFLGTTTMGDPCDVLIGRHRPDGKLAGIACRAETRAFVNGRESSLGYIGQIRIAPGYRGHWLVHRGMTWIKEAGAPGLIYFGVIAAENQRARALLAGARPLGGVHAMRVCGLTTCAVVLRPRRATQMPGLDVQPGSLETLDEIVAFLRHEGPRRQFFPAYHRDDFTAGRRMRGLSPHDLMVARRGGAIVGVMGAWDQAAYKQDVVDAYGRTLGLLRPFYDALARVLGARPLTPVGEAIPLAWACCVCVANDDPSVMRALLSGCSQHAHARGKAFLMIGLVDHDPLLAVARQQLHVTYRSDLFAASWTHDPHIVLDGRIPYIEIATL